MARKPLKPPPKYPETFDLAQELLQGEITSETGRKLTELHDQTPKEFQPEFKYFFDALTAIMPPTLVSEGELE